jgi:hypothetical protein
MKVEPWEKYFVSPVHLAIAAIQVASGRRTQIHPDGEAASPRGNRQINVFVEKKITRIPKG